jgi:hypothetical protein
MKKRVSQGKLNIDNMPENMIKMYVRVNRGKSVENEVLGLSRRRQGFKSPWGLHHKPSNSNMLRKESVGILIPAP